MPVDSLPALVDVVRRLQLLPPSQLAELTVSLPAAFPEPRALAGELVRRGWLTPYQINQIFLDRAAGLVLGSYVVLERLGEGGMGTVYKARHQKLGRVVALKLIRKDRLTHPDAVRRFYREVQAAAQLENPHIVRAYDAGEAGGAHFFVMEHVEGTDLARLVKQHGPPSIERACDYARQAALGLQHAFERGMVHRDIKPANLLLAAKGDVVKVLDMGLARLDRPEMDAGASTTLTQEGAVMGTPDYIAPEQARDSHTVDIRADLYSLGCTLYFLLAGRVPFPGGSLTEKLLKHQMDEPRPVEQVRPETPAAVAAVVRRLMAKRAEDRYQTPAEAAAALASVLIAPLPAPEDVHTLAEGVAIGPSPALRDSADTMDTAGAVAIARRAVGRRRRLAAEGWRRLALYAVAGLLSLGVGGAALVLLIRFAMPPAPPPVTQLPVTPQPAAPPTPTFEDWLKRVAVLSADEQVKAVADELKKRNPGFDGQVTPTVENGVVVGLAFLTDEVTDLAPVRALAGLRTLKCGGSNAGKGRLADLSPLKDMKLTSLDCPFTPVSDLSPLEDMKLTRLHCVWTQVSDLSPLKDMKLTWLDCSFTKVSDLSPLKDMKLTELSSSYTQVSDLSPLKDMKPTNLNFRGTKVSDLSPLKDMKLTRLEFDSAQVSDLSPLKNMPLGYLNCDFHPWRDTELLRSITMLTQINGKSAAEFWKEVDAQRAEFEGWCKQVAAMKPGEQVKAVGDELMKRNPKFDGKVTPTVENGVVVGLAFPTDEVTDIAPVRALMGLRTLTICGSGNGWEKKGKLADLSPLKDMKLTSLNCQGTQASNLSPLKDMRLTSLWCGSTQVSNLSPLKDIKLTNLYCSDTRVSDLSPLKDMKLTTLDCNHTPVSDLSPLKDMPLTYLSCFTTPVSDLSPLKDMKLTTLYCSYSPVSDLSPLKDMKLVVLNCNNTRVSDLSPLTDMPLKSLKCDYNPWRDAELLRSITTLTDINGKSAADFWKEVDAQRAEFDAWCKQVAAMKPDEQVKAVADELKTRNPDFDGAVEHGEENGTVVRLRFKADAVTDVSPVRALSGLMTFVCESAAGKSRLADLYPLQGLPLAAVDVSNTLVADLKPFRKCEGLRLFFATGCPITDFSPLKGLSLEQLRGDFRPERDAAILRSISTLTTINDKPTAEFWKEFEAPVPPKP